MDSKTAYTLGWVWGRLCKEIPNYDPAGRKYEKASQMPLIGFALVQKEAAVKNKLTDKLVAEIAEALAEIDANDVDCGVNPLPIPLQGSWQIGCWHARAGKRIDFSYDVKKHRTEAGLTQAQLADKMGVNQETVSRWETGAVSPSPNNLDALKKIFNEQS